MSEVNVEYLLTLLKKATLLRIEKDALFEFVRDLDCVRSCDGCELPFLKDDLHKKLCFDGFFCKDCDKETLDV